jgi:hypothetical protein
MTDREAIKMALKALEGIHVGNMTPMAEENWNKAITALRQALAQSEPPPSYEYAEIRIRVGDLHIKNAITPDQFLKAHDPFKLLSLLADDCVQHLKEVV